MLKEKIEDIGEFGLIEKLKKLVEAKQSKDANIVISIGDDAAVIDTGGKFYTILTTDSLVENIHFKLPMMPPFALGYKAMAINLSDIAAMAGLPTYALISVGLKQRTEVEFVEELYKGALQAGEQYGVKIVGGDTTSAPALMISLSVLGQVEPAILRRRSEAKVGDLILVTGELGASSAGLELMKDPSFRNKIDQADALIKAHQFPTPRLNEARLVSKYGAHAMEDISDGLASEIIHISQESKVGAQIHLDSLPISSGVTQIAQLKGENQFDFALYGGEDYELVFTANREAVSKIKAQVEAETRTKVSIIGEIVSERDRISLVNSKGRREKLVQHGYEHFRH